MSTSGGSGGGTTVAHAGAVILGCDVPGYTWETFASVSPLWGSGPPQPEGLLADATSFGFFSVPFVGLTAAAENAVQASSLLTAASDAFAGVEVSGYVYVFDAAGTNQLQAAFTQVLDSTSGTVSLALGTITLVGVDLSISADTLGFQSAGGLTYTINLYAQSGWS